MTKPIRVVRRRERFKRLWVWHPINTDPNDDDRWSAYLWLPLFDLLVILGGYVAFFIGSPLLNRLFPSWLVDTVAVIYGAIGLATLAGVCIPKLLVIEAIGKVGISFLLTTYAFLVLNYPSRDAQNNLFITIILVQATWTVYPRLTKLFIRGFRDAAKRKTDKAGRR